MTLTPTPDGVARPLAGVVDNLKCVKVAMIASAGLLALASSRCHDSRVPSAPSRPGLSTPVPTGHSGPVEVTFLDATPLPGVTITGCGTHISGCRSFVRMRFLLRAPQAGTILGLRVFRHATNQLACLMTTTGPFDLPRGEQAIDIVFDESGDCGVPLTVATMAFVVEGPEQVASRQTWRLAYTFTP